MNLEHSFINDSELIIFYSNYITKPNSLKYSQGL
jgi:hypothetical protein